MTDDGVRRHGGSRALCISVGTDGLADGCLSFVVGDLDSMACAPFCVVLALFLGWVGLPVRNSRRCGEVVECPECCDSLGFPFLFDRLMAGWMAVDVDVDFVVCGKKERCWLDVSYISFFNLTCSRLLLAF